MEATDTRPVTLTATNRYGDDWLYQFDGYGLFDHEEAMERLTTLCPNRTAAELAGSLDWARAGTTVRVRR